MNCSIEDCERLRHQRGWCVMHYSRWRRHGDPLKRVRYRHEPSPEKFWPHVRLNLATDGDRWPQFLPVDAALRGGFVLIGGVQMHPVANGWALWEMETGRRCTVRPADKTEEVKAS